METFRWFGLILEGLGSLVASLVTDPTTAPPVSGPVGIATSLGDIFRNNGPIMLLYFAGALSANLALVNALPFPPLDGGRMLMLVLKSIPRYGRRISLRAEQTTYAVGFMALFAFLIWVTVFDIARGVTGTALSRILRPMRRRRALAVGGSRPVRRPTVSVDVGGVLVGSAHPVVVQSMTNTDTADADGTALQVARLAHAGSQLVRVTVNTEQAAAAVPEMVRKLRDNLGVDVPVIGDFHYNGHKLLPQFPDMAAALAKYRINPGNVGSKYHDENFATIVRAAVEHDKPVRIGVNWGSLDQQLLTDLMEANARLPEPRDARDVMIDAMVESAMRSAELAEQTGLRHDRIILSAKVSGVRDLVDTYHRLAPRSDYPLHLGLTEAGMGMKGIVASTAGLALLLNEGIGDTIRVSLTPEPGAGRELEVEVAQQVLQSMGLRSFLPQVSACPGCGRTTSTFFQEMARDITDHIKVRMPAWRETLPGRRGDEGRRDGLRGQRAGRVQARGHRDLAAGHVRGAGGAGVRGREARPDPPRRCDRRRVHRPPRDLRRAPLRARGGRRRGLAGPLVGRPVGAVSTGPP